ncbi:MAG: M48 family metallopeptidase [Candidatus Binatia bacterium]
MAIKSIRTLFAALILASGCAVSSSETPPSRREPQEARRSSGRIDPRQGERLQRVMTPLLQGMNNARRPSQIRIGIIDDPSINAANAGGGEFYVTTGLLEKANDDQLRGVLAHEIAHDDLGHVARAQVLGAGLNIGVLLLEQMIPGSGAVTPIAGTLIARGYSRSEEYAADRHAVTILERAGYSKDSLVNALSWIKRVSGSGEGGLLSTHPATDDRIEALRARG